MEIRDFTFSRVGPYTGAPQRLIMHTDGNPNPHTGLGSLEWGEREAAFTIHWYVDGNIAYRCIPEDRWAWHVLEDEIAWQYELDENGRGDYKALGIEHKMEPDGSWSQATRIASVQLGAQILSRWPNLAVSEHADWDPWTRPNDVGIALYIPDWLADVRDVIAGRIPYRTTQLTANGSPYTGPVPSEDDPDMATLAELEERIANIEHVLYNTWTAEDATRVSSTLGLGGVLQRLVEHIHPAPTVPPAHKHYGTNTGGVV